jgi:hypothetical protein
MCKSPLFKLASRIACLAILTSAALCLNASTRAELHYDCILTQNSKGAVVLLSCGSSAGDTLWNCPNGGGSCTSDPEMDNAASQLCSQYAGTCPPINYID